MSFKKNGYLTIWEVTPVNETLTRARVSSSRKNKQTGEYETDFSGFVGFHGTSAAGRAANLHERDRIRLGDVDVTTKYDKERNITYTNFRIWDFEMADEANNSRSTESHNGPEEMNEPLPDVELPW